MVPTYGDLTVPAVPKYYAVGRYRTLYVRGDASKLCGHLDNMLSFLLHILTFCI